jgi:hypothetical protein
MMHGAYVKLRIEISVQPVVPTCEGQTVKPDMMKVKTKLKLPYKLYFFFSDLSHLQDSIANHSLASQNAAEE